MARALTPASAPKTYAELRRGVEEVVFAGRAKIEQAWLRTYHDTGRLIHEHLLLNQERADYGAKVFNRLADDTGISKRVLYECVQLYRYFPIVRSTAQLTRTHYQVLCQVADQKQRETLTSQTIKNEWTVAELTSRVRAINAALSAGDTSNANGTNGSALKPQVKLLTPKRGTPGLHLIVDRGEQGLAVDLGFKLYRPIEPGAARLRPYKAGEIVRLDADGNIRRVEDATKADLFTYSATIRRVVDGDTLVIAIQVAPGIWLEEKLRLRGIDCPELSTPEGKAAKRFVEALVANAESVTICTTKPDKYDRYLADVFVGRTKDQGQETSVAPISQPSALTSQLHAEGVAVFLNNVLLENAHAVRKDSWELTDWEPL